MTKTEKVLNVQPSKSSAEYLDFLHMFQDIKKPKRHNHVNIRFTDDQMDKIKLIQKQTKASVTRIVTQIVEKYLESIPS